MSDYRFSRGQRLLQAAEYKRVFAKARRSSDRCLTVLMRPNNDQPARLGLAIAKKQVRRAVDRNRIKRVLRESFRQHKLDLTGMDFVVLARRDTATIKNEELYRSLERHWQHLIREFSR